MNYFQETLDHVDLVNKYAKRISIELCSNTLNHDNSKMQDPERDHFMKFIPLLRDSDYGSEEYQGFLKDLKVALDHHYKVNRHHPEHFENGISGMTLVDLIEMFCDWLAATKRHNSGNIYKSIEINKNRFNMTNQLVSIFENTAKEIFKEGKEE